MAKKTPYEEAETLRKWWQTSQRKNKSIVEAAEKAGDPKAPELRAKYDASVERYNMKRNQIDPRLTTEEAGKLYTPKGAYREYEGKPMNTPPKNAGKKVTVRTKGKRGSETTTTVRNTREGDKASAAADRADARRAAAPQPPTETQTRAAEVNRRITESRANKAAKSAADAWVESLAGDKPANQPATSRPTLQSVKGPTTTRATPAPKPPKTKPEPSKPAPKAQPAPKLGSVKGPTTTVVTQAPKPQASKPKKPKPEKITTKGMQPFGRPTVKAVASKPMSGKAKAVIGAGIALGAVGYGAYKMAEQERMARTQWMNQRISELEKERRKKK